MKIRIRDFAARNARPGTGGLVWVIHIASALSLGAMAGTLWSLKQVNPTIEFDITYGTWVAFAGGAAWSWCYWQFVLGRELTARRLAGGGGLLAGGMALCTFGGFAYQLRGASESRIRDVLQGVMMALFLVSGFGVALWRIARFLEEDHRRHSGEGQGRNRGGKREDR